MEKIDIKEYFIEIIDEGRSTIGYGCVPYKTNELVHKIYKQNDELKRLKQKNEELKTVHKQLKQMIKSKESLLEKAIQENAELKEKIIKLTEENGNLIINRNTVENKLRDTESRLISVQKANTHNLVLLQRRNNTLEEIREIAEKRNYLNLDEVLDDILDKINEVLGNE